MTCEESTLLHLCAPELGGQHQARVSPAGDLCLIKHRGRRDPPPPAHSTSQFSSTQQLPSALVSRFELLPILSLAPLHLVGLLTA